VLAALVGGCGGEKTIATGSVTAEIKKMQGTPIANATVVLYPQEGAPVTTTTDAAGRFTADVPLGDARVAVIPSGQGSASSTDTSPDAVEKPAPPSEFQPRFSSPDSSGLTVKVEKVWPWCSATSTQRVECLSRISPRFETHTPLRPSGLGPPPVLTSSGGADKLTEARYRPY
jgi:hypothetical protein